MVYGLLLKQRIFIVAFQHCLNFVQVKTPSTNKGESNSPSSWMKASLCPSKYWPTFYEVRAQRTEQKSRVLLFARFERAQ